MTVDPGIVIGLNAVIIALSGEEPRVMTVSVPENARIEGGDRTLGRPAGPRIEALPTGPLDPTGDRTLDLALRRWVTASAGIDLGYVEQLYTFGDRFRDPFEVDGGARVISVAYLALVGAVQPGGAFGARWRSVYHFLPWEDGRLGRPPLVDQYIVPALDRWIRDAGEEPLRTLRRERASLAFGLGGAPWDGERVLERYEILYELGLVDEAVRDRRRMEASHLVDHPDRTEACDPGGDREMAFDHRRILATALGRIRAKIKYRPVVFELMPETFTLFHLQRAVEALAGVRLHKQNFRRLVEKGGLVEGTRKMDMSTGGRPAELFRFRREVLLERPAPGVGLPGRKRG